MSTAVIIVCNHRTGSGLLSSMLHTLGVPMLPTAEPTRTGDDMWEDHQFVKLHRDIFREITASGKYDPTAWRYPSPKYTAAIIREYRFLLRERATQEIWGFKDPRTVFVLDFVLGLMHGLEIETKLVWLTRGLSKVAASLEKRDDQKWPTDHRAVAEHQFAQWQLMRNRHFNSCHSIDVRYEDLVRDPSAITGKLRAVIDPLVDPTVEQEMAAFKLVRRVY